MLKHIVLRAFNRQKLYTLNYLDMTKLDIRRSGMQTESNLYIIIGFCSGSVIYSITNASLKLNRNCTM